MGFEALEAGWLVDGFQCWVALWAWTGLVLLHWLWRSILAPGDLPLRPSGPVG